MGDAAKSPGRQAFVHYLRTGQRIPKEYFDGNTEVEVKFNPYHDPRNGQFTFAPGGPRSLSQVVISRRTSRGSGTRDSLGASAKPARIPSSEQAPNEHASKFSDAVFRSDIAQPSNLSTPPRPTKLDGSYIIVQRK